MEKELKNNYGLGIFGALVGALIGAIPWVLMYIFSDMMYAILSIAIVLCSYYGYKMTKAKIDKKLPIIISVSSFIAITVTMFIMIPICVMVKNAVPICIEALKILYSNNDFLNALSTDYLISLLFSFVVISGIVINLNKQIRAGIDRKNIKLIANDAGNDTYSKEEIEIVRQAFEKNEAMDKEHIITKELIIEELEKNFDEKKARGIFDYLKIQNIIKKRTEKYYFSEKAQSSALYRYGITNLKTFIIVILIATVLAGAIIYSEQKQQEEINNSAIDSKEYELGIDSLKLQLPEDMAILSEEQIRHYFGEEYAQVYDCLAVSNDFKKIIMVFTDEKTEENKDQTPKEYIEEEMRNKDLKINEKKIGVNTFYSVELTYVDKGTEYVSVNYVYDGGDKFICIVCDTLANDKIKLEDIVR